MILTALMLMQATFSPETEAVMNRSRREAQERRTEQHRVQEKQAEAVKPGLSHYLPPEVAGKLQVCIENANGDPASGLAFAQEWAKDGGGFSAAQCVGYAQARAEKWDDAVSAFESAAQAARQEGAAADAARLSAQAGNAALAGGMPDKARNYFDEALKGALPEGTATGEIHLDRARAMVILGHMTGARNDLDAALHLVPDDPLAWLLSATLARRQNDLARAKADIGEAVKRAPDDASVALEQGNIAVLTGDDAGAKSAWERVIELEPSSAQADAARDMLGRLEDAAKADKPAASVPQSK